MNTATEVLSKIDYKSFYTRHIPGFKSNGKPEVSCLCPFHEDKNPSLSVNVETGLFNCFGCGEKGNAIQFLQKKEGIGFNEALNLVKKEEGIESKARNVKSETRSKKPETSGKPTYLTLDQVKILHNQLMKNEAVLKVFLDKYGLSMETVEKYLIGYQNEHYVIPIEVESDRWTLKEHKGSQTKGSTVSLYPSGVIKEYLPFIIVAEGEFKALLLNQMGFPAVSGTAGAGTWQREWNSLFTNLNVILAYDHDEPGRHGALKVVESLKGTAKSVKQVLWPSCMDSKDKKDVTDFFVTLGKTKADFQILIDSAKEIAYEVKEIDGIRFVEPSDFVVSADGINQLIFVRETNQQGKEKSRRPQRTVCYTPLFLTQRTIDVDCRLQGIEIAFRQEGKWEKIEAPRRVISDSKKIIELSDRGLPVNSHNAGKLVEYLSAFESFNGCSPHDKKQKGCKSLIFTGYFGEQEVFFS
ncbi:MAG: DUF927 domain-containing protein [Candidatus Brocadia sp.]|nr:DUF927 domain-containing protein [Candidatus Brocadia sp.]